MIINFDNTIKSKLIDVFNNENSAVLIVDAGGCTCKYKKEPSVRLATTNYLNQPSEKLLKLTYSEFNINRLIAISWNKNYIKNKINDDLFNIEHPKYYYNPRKSIDHYRVVDSFGTVIETFKENSETKVSFPIILNELTSEKSQKYLRGTDSNYNDIMLIVQVKNREDVIDVNSFVASLELPLIIKEENYLNFNNKLLGSVYLEKYVNNDVVPVIVENTQLIESPLFLTVDGLQPYIPDGNYFNINKIKESLELTKIMYDFQLSRNSDYLVSEDEENIYFIVDGELCNYMRNRKIN